MEWLEITINCPDRDPEALADRLTALGVEGFAIEDEAEFGRFLEENRKYWDYVDQKFTDSIAGVSRVKFYLEQTEAGAAELERLREELPDRTFLLRTVRDEDWENNWKQYYKPIPVGEKLMIVPEWEEIPQSSGRKILRLDPGLIFGTGSHATTQMCLRAIEQCVFPGAKFLDLGCGSGILSIAAVLLGASEALGCDIDPKAPGVVASNAALNGIGSDRLTAFSGDVLSGRRSPVDGRRFDVVAANIVADVILSLCPRIPSLLAPHGKFLCSGILSGREQEVRDAAAASGLHIDSEQSLSGWFCFVLSAD